MLIADLHIHSKYSRATSSQSVPAQLDLWARRKGIDVVGTGDFTHPAWRAHRSKCAGTLWLLVAREYLEGIRCV